MKPYFQDDLCTIYHGDCREILPTLDPVDLVLTDPPYGVGLGDKPRSSHMRAHADGGYGFSDTIENVVTNIIPTIEICRRMAKRVILTPGTRALWRYPEPDCIFGTFNPAGAGIGKWQAFTCWQPILAYGERPSHIKGCFPDTFQYTESSDHCGHPCPKPIRLWTKILMTFGADDETVIDPFMGSGTTLRAAKDLGRRAIGIEIEERYCEIAANRLAQECLPFTEES